MGRDGVPTTRSETRSRESPVSRFLWTGFSFDRGNVKVGDEVQKERDSD